MKELMIALQSGGDEATGQKIPLYEQIYAAIRTDIEEGSITCGEKLPSTRLLASNLGVSRFTVDLAYGQLVSEGYIQARAGSGFFVCDLSELPAGVHGSPAPVSPMPLHEEAQAQIDFSPFAVDLAHFPYNLWKKRGREVFNEVEGLLTAGDAKGDLRLRTILANYLYRARGVRCMPEQILIGAGNEYLLLLLAQLLEKPRVAMESPTYVQAYEVLRRAGAEVYPVPMDGEGLCLPLPEGCPANVLYVMPSHQFPIGTVMPLKRRQEVLDWAACEGRYIIEDDHDSEFRYVGKPIPSLQGRDAGERVIYLGTFSKSISPALRMSYMVLPPSLSRRFKEQFGFYSSTVSTWQQRLVCRFMESGDFERHLNRMRRVYKAKHDVLLRELRTKPWVRAISGENAGLHLVVTVKSNLPEQDVLARARAQGVRIYGLGSYHIAGRPEDMQLYGLGSYHIAGRPEDMQLYGPGSHHIAGKTENMENLRPCGETTKQFEGVRHPEADEQLEKVRQPEADMRSAGEECLKNTPAQRFDNTSVTLVLGFGGLTEAEITEGLRILDKLLIG